MLGCGPDFIVMAPDMGNRSCLQRFVDFPLHSYLAHADLDQHEDVGWWLHIPIVPSRGPLTFC